MSNFDTAPHTPDNTVVTDDANTFMAADAGTQLECLFRLLTVNPNDEDYQFAQVAKQKLHHITCANVKYGSLYSNNILFNLFCFHFVT
jgi:hypothetical protein